MVDFLGVGANTLNGQTISLQPWDLIVGGNGHICIAWKFVHLMNLPTLLHATRADGLPSGPPWVQGRDALFTSPRVIMIHTTIINNDEYGRTLEPIRITLARKFLRDIGHTISLSPPGLSDHSVGGLVTWSSQNWHSMGHSECFEFSRLTPIPMGPSHRREIYITQLQNRLHCLFDGLRLILGFTAVKPVYHLSIRRW
jgi:hypothetical protein